jgi:uncharacterized membrane protein YdjX (TVP38/TMEM64 family)
MKLTVLSPRLRTLIFGLLIALLVVLVFYGYHEGLWKTILHTYRPFFHPKYLYRFIASFGPYAAVAFVLVQCLQVVVAPVPGDVTGFVGGLFFGVFWGTVLSTVGLVLGSLAAFALARTFGVGLVKKIVKQDFIDRFNAFAVGRGFILFFVFFLVPGMPKDSACYLLGLTSMGYLDFILLNLFARLPGTVMLTLQGHAFKEERYLIFFILLLGSACFIGILYCFRNHILCHFRDRMGHGNRSRTEEEIP